MIVLRCTGGSCPWNSCSLLILQSAFYPWLFLFMLEYNFNFFFVRWKQDENMARKPQSYRRKIRWGQPGKEKYEKKIWEKDEKTETDLHRVEFGGDLISSPLEDMTCHMSLCNLDSHNYHDFLLIIPKSCHTLMTHDPHMKMTQSCIWINITSRKLLDIMT